MSAPQIARLPDISGRGAAWRATDGARDKSNPDQLATVRAYLVHAPHGHPLWPWYMVACVHLRPVEGCSKPPYKRFEEASHEFLIVASIDKTADHYREGVHKPGDEKT